MNQDVTKMCQIFKKPHTYTNARPVSAARPSLAHLLPGGGREGALAAAPHSGRRSPGSQWPRPWWEVSAGFATEFTTCSTPHSELGVASLSPASAVGPGLGELSLDVQTGS